MDRPRNAAVVLLLGALFPLARVLLDPFGVVPGDELGDVYKHVWSFWHATAAPGLWTGLLNAPEGGLLLDVMWVPSRLLIPVTLVAGPVFAANLWVLLSLFAIGVSTWALARDLVGGAAGPLAAGLIAQTSPFVLSYPLHSGVHERLTLWVFPLVLLALIRVAQRGDLRWGAAGVVGVAVAVSGCQVYGPFIALEVGLVTPFLLWSHPNRARLVGVVLATALVLVALFALTLWTAEHAQSLSIQEDRVTFALDVVHGREVARPELLFDPWSARTRGYEWSGDRLLKVQYLGWVPTLLALIGVAVARSRMHVALAVGVAVIAVLIALGPQLGGLPNPLHYIAVRSVPALGIQPNLWQLTALVGPLAAVGVAACIERGPSVRLRWILAISVVVLTLVERGIVSPASLVVETAEARPSPVLDVIGDEGGVVVVPRAYRGNNNAHGGLFLDQTAHERPLGVAINVGSAGLDSYGPVLDGRALRWSGAALCLRKGGFRWLVVRKDWLEDDGLADAMGELGAPVDEDDRVAVYDLGAPQPSGVAPPLSPGGGANEVRLQKKGCPYEP